MFHNTHCASQFWGMGSFVSTPYKAVFVKIYIFHVADQGRRLVSSFPFSSEIFKFPKNVILVLKYFNDMIGY